MLRVGLSAAVVTAAVAVGTGAGFGRSAAAAPADATVVEGRVLWDDGAPADGALVFAQGPPGTPACATKSARNGSFRLVCRQAVGVNVQAVPIEDPSRPPKDVEFGAEQFSADRPPRYTRRPQPWRVTLTLPRPATVSGQVLEPDGAPAIGAFVQWSPTRGLLPGLDDTRERVTQGARWVAETDGQGRFVLHGIEREIEGTVAALSEAHTPVRVAQVLPGTRDLVLRFPVGASIAGRVEAPGGAPPPRFTVELVGIPSDEDDESTRRLNLSIMSFVGGREARLLSICARKRIENPTGTFVVPGVGPGRYDLRVRADDGRLGWSQDLVVVEGKAASPLVVAIGKVALSGRVVNADTGQPLRDVVVKVAPDPSAPVAATDAKGRFVLPVGEPGRAVVLFAGDPPDRFMVRPTAAGGDVGDLAISRRWDTKPGAALELGIQVEPSLSGPFVEEVRPEKPGAAAGLRAGDHFVSVAGRSVEHLGPGATLQLIASARGPEVDLEVRRPSAGTTFHLTLKRGPASDAR
jgi:hypothetical protein